MGVINELLVNYFPHPDATGDWRIRFSVNGTAATLYGTPWTFRTFHGSRGNPPKTLPVDTRVTSLEKLLVHTFPAPEFKTVSVPVKYEAMYAMRIGSRMYTLAYAMTPCANCQESFWTHPDGKCCFETTSFKPLATFPTHMFLEDALRKKLME